MPEVRENITTYDPAMVITTFGGTPLSGFADGTFIDIVPEGKAFTRKTGADGETVRSRGHKNCHDVTMTFQQSSASNDYLSQQNQIDRETNHNLLPLAITDLNGKTLCSWPEAWVEVPDSWGYAGEVTDRPWVFHTGKIGTDNRGSVDL